MGKANGIVLRLSKARQRVFHEALDEQDFFCRSGEQVQSQSIFAADLFCG